MFKNGVNVLCSDETRVENVSHNSAMTISNTQTNANLECRWNEPTTDLHVCFCPPTGPEGKSTALFYEPSWQSAYMPASVSIVQHTLRWFLHLKLHAQPVWSDPMSNPMCGVYWTFGFLFFFRLGMIDLLLWGATGIFKLPIHLGSYGISITAI